MRGYVDVGGEVGEGGHDWDVMLGGLWNGYDKGCGGFMEMGCTGYGMDMGVKCLAFDDGKGDLMFWHDFSLRRMGPGV